MGNSTRAGDEVIPDAGWPAGEREAMVSRTTMKKPESRDVEPRLSDMLA